MANVASADKVMHLWPVHYLTYDLAPLSTEMLSQALYHGVLWCTAQQLTELQPVPLMQPHVRSQYQQLQQPAPVHCHLMFLSCLLLRQMSAAVNQWLIVNVSLKLVKVGFIYVTVRWFSHVTKSPCPEFIGFTINEQRNEWMNKPVDQQPINQPFSCLIIRMTHHNHTIK